MFFPLLKASKDAPWSKRRAILIANPRSGAFSEQKIGKAMRLLEKYGTSVESVYTSVPGDGITLASEAVLKEPDFVIAAGGDGTFNEVINGIEGTAIPMAILPMGTTNILADEIGIDGDVIYSVWKMLRSRPRRVSLGKITQDGRSRYFCLMTGVGYDAAVVRRLNLRLKHYTGNFAYVASGLLTLASWSPEALKVTVDGKKYECQSLIASNAKRYAGDYRLAPGADISAPELHIFLIHGKGRLDILKFAMALLIEKHMGMKGITYVKGRDVEVVGDASVQVDGEPLGSTPAHISVVPEALNLIY